MTLRFLALAIAATGCASSNYRALSPDPTGPSLSVRPIYEKAPIVRRTNFTASDGTSTGAAETVVGYRDVLTGFYHARGEARIDEQDFYRLAGKDDVAEAIGRSRTKGLLMNRAGIAMMVASSVAAIAIPVAAGDRTLAKYSVGQWFIAFPIGLGFTIFGKRRVERSDNYSAAHAFAALGTDAPGWASNLPN